MKFGRRAQWLLLKRTFLTLATVTAFALLLASVEILAGILRSYTWPEILKSLVFVGISAVVVICMVGLVRKWWSKGMPIPSLRSWKGRTLFGLLCGGVAIYLLWGTTVSPTAWKILHWTLVSLVAFAITSALIVWWWKKGHRAKIMIWTLVVLFMVGAVVLGLCFWNCQQKQEQERNAIARRAEAARTAAMKAEGLAATNTPPVVETPKWEWTWETLNGEYIHGRRKNADNEVSVRDLRFLTNGDLYFDVPYVNYGKPQTERIRLSKIGEGVWLGDRDQDDPLDHTRVRLEEMVPGVAYGGTITWPNKVVASCKLKIVRRE